MCVCCCHGHQGSKNVHSEKTAERAQTEENLKLPECTGLAPFQGHTHCFPASAEMSSLVKPGVVLWLVDKLIFDFEFLFGKKIGRCKNRRNWRHEDSWRTSVVKARCDSVKHYFNSSVNYRKKTGKTAWRPRQRRDSVIVFVIVVPEAASLTCRRKTSAKQTQLKRFTNGRAPR